MQLTIHQIYALFSMLAGAIVLIGLSYCAGLRTGREAGYKQGGESAKRYAKCLLKVTQAEQAELRGMLEREEQLSVSINRQLATLRTAFHQEQAEHNTIIQDLLDELESERGNSLTLDDCQALRRAARLLGHAADQVRKTGTTKTNHAAEAQNQVNAIAERLHTALTAPKPLAQMADSCITDTDMIEWLNDNAIHYLPDLSMVQIEMPTRTAAAPTWPPHLRDMLHTAIAKDQAARSTWERVDATTQPAAAQCM